MSRPGAERIRDDLRGLFRGELRFDPVTASLFSTDASIFQIRPLGVAAPLDEDDLCTLVRYAAEQQIPLTPRGAGTGLAGESLGRGLVVDLSRHFRAFREISPDTARVQPGVVLASLNAELAKTERRFAPDPASGSACTIGGMIATDASGSRAPKHGSTRDHVEDLRVVWDDGTADRVGFGGDESIPAPRTRQITHDVHHILQIHAAAIAAHRDRPAPRRLGYRIEEASVNGVIRLPRLLVGSEGTLGFVTEATLRTVPLPGGRSALRCAFAEIVQAIRAARAVEHLRPSACDMLDRRLVALNREEPFPSVPESAEAVLLIEFEAETRREAADVVRDAVSAIRRSHAGPAMVMEVTATPVEVDRFWYGREAALPGLSAMGPGRRPLPFVEDIAVPAGSLENYAGELRRLLQRLEVTASFMAHVLTGQIHLRPLLDLNRDSDRSRLWEIADAIHELTWAHGGTISGQHGVGVARTPWVARQAGPMLPVWRDVKAAFDPRGLLNPGKIIGPDPELPAWPLREPLPEPAEPKPRERIELPESAFAWKVGGWLTEAGRCNGCGECRDERPGRRMCPIFRADPREAASPRAKANVLCSSPEPVGSDRVRAVADLCVNCRMCASECPSKVDIPRLMIEAKAANHAAHGRSRQDALLARTERLAALGSILAPAANRMMKSRVTRWVLERLFGVSRHRMLPAFARRSFLRLARRNGWTRPPRNPVGEPVALFVDVFANFNDTTIAEAAFRVLQHNRVPVFVPDRQTGCGMAPLAQGDVEAARRAANRNVRALAELVRSGYRVVCTEPTAALMLSQDYPMLLDDPDSRAIADRTMELTAYLLHLHRDGRLRTDFHSLDLTVGHHVPCHLKALGGPPAGPGLLALIPGLRVRTIDRSCSGMAGNHGLRAEHFEESLLSGKPMLDEMSRPGVIAGSTECGTCRMQMHQGAGKRTLHPVQYLALAYGLMPGLAEKLASPPRGLVSE